MEINQLHVIKRIQDRVEELEKLIRESTTYDDLEEVHDAITEIQFDEKSMKEWIMKSIQDQRKSELKELVLDAITPENNFLTVGNVSITLVKYEYDTVDDLERALGDSISPESSEEYG